jgi:hypothetical protein
LKKKSQNLSEKVEKAELGWMEEKVKKTKNRKKIDVQGATD